MGKSEKRELANHTAVWLALLLKWQFRSESRSRSGTDTIDDRFERIALAPKETLSLKTALPDEDSLRTVWLDARSQARIETGLDVFPIEFSWSTGDLLGEDGLLA